MNRIFFLFMMLYLTSMFTAAQPIFNFGPELGLSVSQFPEKNNSVSESGNDKVESKTLPVFGPLAGIHAQLVLKKTFLFTTGLQYNIAGKRFTSHEEGFNSMHNLPFTADVTEKQTFHKICLPFSAGITFPLFKIHLSIYGGWRGNYFFDARYYKHTIVSYPDKPDYNDDITEDVNPLKIEECPTNIKPFHNQYFFGISFSKGRFELALNHYSGLDIFYSTNPLVSSIEYKNNDNSVSIRYRFYGLRKQKTPCNLFS